MLKKLQMPPSVVINAMPPPRAGPVRKEDGTVQNGPMAPSVPALAKVSAAIDRAGLWATWGISAQPIPAAMAGMHACYRGDMIRIDMKLR